MIVCSVTVVTINVSPTERWLETQVIVNITLCQQNMQTPTESVQAELSGNILFCFFHILPYL